MITEDCDTWYFNGKETTTKTGDILFARAWYYHGVKMSADNPLEFVVFKYAGRHIDSPTDPAPSSPKERAE